MNHSIRVPLVGMLLSIVLLGSLVACQRGSAGTATPAGDNAKGAAAPAGLDHSQVCFINNRYMGVPQLAVEVDGKTYYGCCPGCVTALRGDASTRVAKDPYTAHVVDKATAFIVRDPGSPDAVLYFESAGTFAEYSRTHGEKRG